MSKEKRGSVLRILSRNMPSAEIVLGDDCEFVLSGADAAITIETPNGSLSVYRVDRGVEVRLGGKAVWWSASVAESKRRREAALQALGHPTRQQVEQALIDLGWSPNAANAPESGTWYSDLGSAHCQWIIMDCALDAPAEGKTSRGRMSVDDFRNLVLRARREP